MYPSSYRYLKPCWECLRTEDVHIIFKHTLRPKTLRRCDYGWPKIPLSPFNLVNDWCFQEGMHEGSCFLHELISRALWSCLAVCLYTIAQLVTIISAFLSPSTKPWKFSNRASLMPTLPPYNPRISFWKPPLPLPLLYNKYAKDLSLSLSPFVPCSCWYTW